MLRLSGSNPGEKTWLYAGKPENFPLLMCYHEHMSDNARNAGNQQERSLMQFDSSYVVGLIDGEGYFSVSARRRKQKNWILHDVKLTFGIKLKAEDGLPVLNALQKYFDCGFVYFRKDPRENFCDCYEYQVNTHREIIGKIIPFFLKHHLQFPSKRTAFDSFYAIAEMIQRREHLENGGIEKIQKLAVEMH